MRKQREFKKVGAIIGLVVATCFVGAVGCREKPVEDESTYSLPEDTHPLVAEPTKSESVPPPPIGLPIRSDDGKYEAYRLSDGKGGEHFRITRGANRTVVLTTHSKYPTPNDVKAGKFSSDSTKFAAAYHYGDGQEYTWIGVWSLEEGERVSVVELRGEWSSIIPDSVFEEQEATTAGPEDAADKPSKSEQWDLRSPDGKYGATKISHKGGIHWKVGETESGRVVFITHGQYPTPNDVKAGRFSSDSTKFAASYHYGHAGNYTWVGIWSLKTEKLIRSKRLSGWKTAVPNSVFEENEGS